MSKQSKPIKLFPYDSNWPQKFETEASDIKKFLNDQCLELHHIGSTSIPGMIAKEDLDILLVVKHLSDSLKLQQHGFIYKGELNTPLRFYFSKNTDRSKVNLHVCEQKHGFIGLNLVFRDYLRLHPKEAEKYANIKLKALKNPNAHHKIRQILSFYGICKNRFIKSIIKKSNYQGLSIYFCMHENEWEEYHRIKNEQIFKPLGIIYDVNHSSFSNPRHHHFCLYKGCDVVAIAHIERATDHKAILHFFCIDPSHQTTEIEKYFLSFLEKWIGYQDVAILYLHSNIQNVLFYQELGYKFMKFDDLEKALPLNTVDMGKIL